MVYVGKPCPPVADLRSIDEAGDGCADRVDPAVHDECIGCVECNDAAATISNTYANRRIRALTVAHENAVFADFTCEMRRISSAYPLIPNVFTSCVVVVSLQRSIPAKMLVSVLLILTSLWIMQVVAVSLSNHYRSVVV